MHLTHTIYALKLLLVLPLFAQSPAKKPVVFSHTQDVGLGNEVCVLGDHPDLGGGVVQKAIKLAWSPGNVWNGTVAIEAGATVNYRFISRSNDRSQWCDDANFTDLTSLTAKTVPSHEPGPYSGKTILYLSTWPQAEILYRDLKSGGPWTQLPMRKVGPGRNAGESEFRIDGIATTAGAIEFVFTDGAGSWDNAPAPPNNTAPGSFQPIPVPYENLTGPYNYRTPLDVFLVQDGEVYNYRPAPTVSPAIIQVGFITSTTPGIPSRTVRIFFPRGFTEHTTKRYPVLYMHDGQNAFYPGGTFGTWDADRIARYETSMGRMRECIILAVDNAGAARIAEYTPPSDDQVTNPGNDGMADDYLTFLINDVKASMDNSSRTLGFENGAHNPQESIVLGSSMGGLVSDYITFTRSDVFGAAGVMSPAYWTSPNFAATRDAAAKLPRRLHLTVDTAEGSTSFWNDSFRAYNAWTSDGHTLNSELQLKIGCGDAHNERAWSARLPEFFHHLLNPWHEPNFLLEELYPPKLEKVSIVPGAATFTLQARRGITYELQRSDNLTAPWFTLPTTHRPQSVTEPWKTITILDDTWTAPSHKMFWRARYHR